MSKANTKQLYLGIKDLSFKSEQLVVDLLRFLSETLPQIKIVRNAFEADITAPVTLSKRTFKLRIKRFLHKKGLTNDYRAISIKDVDKDGFIVKEKRMIELSYY